MLANCFYQERHYITEWPFGLSDANKLFAHQTVMNYHYFLLVVRIINVCGNLKEEAVYTKIRRRT